MCRASNGVGEAVPSDPVFIEASEFFIEFFKERFLLDEVFDYIVI